MNANNKLISNIYFICAVICLFRGVLNLINGRTGIGVPQALMGVLFVVIGLLYRRRA